VDELRDPACDVDSFISSLKQSCSALTSVTSALEVIFNVMRSINPRFTYLLTITNLQNTMQIQQNKLLLPAEATAESINQSIDQNTSV